MPRTLKKNVYGFIFLLIIFLLGYGIYLALGFGRNDNGNEVITGTIPIEVIRDPVIMQIGDELSVVARVFNPNFDFKASNFRFNFNLYDRFGRNFEVVTGEGFIDALERKYIYSFFDTDKERIVNVDMELDEIKWERVDLDWHEYELVDINASERDEGGYVVEGKFINKEAAPVRRVMISAVFFDLLGNPLAVSEIAISDIGGFGERIFRITPPIFNVGTFGINLRSTNVFVKKIE